MRIEEKYISDMIAHALEETPNECCGILTGVDGVVSHLYRIANISPREKRRSLYQMDSQEQLNAELDSERNGWEFLAFYHSHTHSSAYPSQTDVRMALENGWLDVYYVLISLEDESDPYLRAYRITDAGDIVEEVLQII